MNKFVGLLITVVALAALAGAAIGWRFPFLGQSRTSNELETAQDGTGNQPVNPTPTRNTRLGTAQPQSNNPTTARVPNTTGGQGGTATAQPVQQDAAQPVQALW